MVRYASAGATAGGTGCLPGQSQRFRGAGAFNAAHHDSDGDIDIAAPGGMSDDRSYSGPGPDPSAHLGPVEQERARRCRCRSRLGPCRQQRPMGHTHRRHIEHRAEVERESGPSWMVPSGCVDQEDIEPHTERPDRR